MARRALLLVILLGLPAAGAPLARPVRPPLQRLASAISASLPGIERGAYRARRIEDGTVPAMLRPEKALALWERAGLSAEELGPAERARPEYALLQSINSTLLELAVEDLNDEQAQAVAGLILDRRSGRQEPDLPAVEALAAAHLARQLSLRGLLKRRAENPVPEPWFPQLTYVKGVPEHVRLAPQRRRSAWRHYTSRFGLSSIVAGARLLNGVVPYARPVIEAARYSLVQPWEAYSDLTGIFLTLPHVSSERVEIGTKAKEEYFVDLRLPQGLSVLEIEPGAIYLLPLPRRTPRAERRDYARWASRGEIHWSQIPDLRRLDREGGPGPDLLVPIEIVDYGPAPSLRISGRSAR